MQTRDTTYTEPYFRACTHPHTHTHTHTHTTDCKILTRFCFNLTLISMLHVFGRIRSINERVESTIQASRKEYEAAKLCMKIPPEKKSCNLLDLCSAAAWEGYMDILYILSIPLFFFFFIVYFTLNLCFWLAVLAFTFSYIFYLVCLLLCTNIPGQIPCMWKPTINLILILIFIHGVAWLPQECLATLCCIALTLTHMLDYSIYNV